MIEPTALMLRLAGIGVRVVWTAGFPSTSVKGCAVTTPRDIRYGGDPIFCANKTRYRCRNDT